MQENHPFGHNVLTGIEASRGDLPEALARIADFILREPEVAVRASMAELADLSGSGEASIVRFYRRLGFDSFPDLKIALASDIAYRGHADPGAHDLGTRIAEALRAVIDAPQRDELRQVAQRMVAARHVDIFGSGLSGMIAGMFAYRLSWLGLVARSFQDPVETVEVAGALDTRSVFVTISETGLTAHTRHMLTLAGERGAYRVAVSGRRIAELNKLCDTVLIAPPLSPLPERGELSPAIAKIVLCELIADEIERLP